MSTNYKVKKYCSKLESAPVDKMDKYYEKIKKYKQIQNGGADGKHSWDAYISQKRKDAETAGKVDEGLKEKIDESMGKLNTVTTTIETIKKNQTEVSVALTDALTELKKLADGIKPEQMTQTLIDDLITAITNLKVEDVKEIDPEKIWNTVNPQPKQ